MASTAKTLNETVEAARKAAAAEEPRLEAAYLAQLRNALAQAVARYKAIAGLALAAAADWTPPSVADVLAIQVRSARIRDGQRRMMANLAGTVSEIEGVDFDLTSPITQEILDGLGARAEAAVGESLREPIANAIATGWAEGLSVPDTARLMQRTTRSQLGGKATMLARTDLIGMSNAAGQGVAHQLNTAAKDANEQPPIGTKIWLSSHDGRVRDTHAAADGQRVPIDQPYSVGGEPLMYPGDPSGSNAEVINCRCTELYDDTPAKKPTPKEAAIMEGRSDWVNETLGANVDTQMKYQPGGPGTAYTPERQALHREIIESFLSHGRPVAEGQKPTATFLSGGSGAGKSSVKRVLQEEGKFPTHAVDIDPDAIKELLPEYQAAKEAGVTDGARIAHEESSDISKMILKEATARRNNLVIDGTGDAEPGKFLGKLVTQQDAGYDVDVIMVDLRTDIAVERAMERARRSLRFVPEDVIRQIHADVAARFEEWKDAPAVRSWQLWANEDRPPKLVASRRLWNAQDVIVEPRRYREFLVKGGLRQPPKPVTEFLDRRQLRTTFVGDRKGRTEVEDTIKYLNDLIDPEALGMAQDRLAPITPDGQLPVANLPHGEVALGRLTTLGKTPVSIQMKLDGPRNGTTFLHEFGHLLDHSALSDGEWATVKRLPAMTKVIDAARNTDTGAKFRAALVNRKATLNADRGKPNPLFVDVSEKQYDWIEYAYSSKEMWARLFAQWAAKHPKAPAWLRQQMDDEIAAEHDLTNANMFDLPTQWADEEFATLAPLIEDVLREAGVLRDEFLAASGQIDDVLPGPAAGLVVAQPRQGVVGRPPVRVDEYGDHVVVAGPLLAEEFNRDQTHSGESTPRRRVIASLDGARTEGDGRGDPVRRRDLGRPGRAAAVRDGSGEGRVSSAAAVAGVREAPREGQRTRTLTSGRSLVQRPRAPGEAARPGLDAGVPFGGELPPEAEMTVASAPTQPFATAVAPVEDGEAVGGAWHSDIAFEGLSTGDGRFIVSGALSWREPPLSLMAMIETTEGGHLGAQVSGRMETFAKQKAAMDGSVLPDGVIAVYGTGHFDLGEYGSEIERMVSTEVLRGISVDMSIADWAFRDPDTGEIIDPETADDSQWEKAFLGEYEMAILDGTILAATVCPTPAFADAKIALLASATQHFGHTWRANAYAAQAFDVPVGQLCTTVQASIRYADVEHLHASAGFPVKPPKEWFFRPEADRAVPLTFTPDGEVYGHIAAWTTCHTGYINGAWSQCITPPRSRTGYSHFHVGEIPTQEGDLIPIGKLMLGEAHAPGGGSRNAARGFYDRTGSVGCHVRATDGRYGIWVSGAIRSDLTDEQWRDLNANPPSGDWRSVDGNLELIAAIAVPVPGFPIPRSQLSLAASADGEMYVASLILTPDWNPTDTFEADALAAWIEGGSDGLAALIDG